jgi:hypothetical protein
MSNELKNEISHLEFFIILEKNINRFMRNIIKNRYPACGSIASYETGR